MSDSSEEIISAIFKSLSHSASLSSLLSEKHEGGFSWTSLASTFSFSELQIYFTTIHTIKFSIVYMRRIDANVVK